MQIEALLEFPEGAGGLRKSPFREGGMDIFWYYTFSFNHSLHNFLNIAFFNLILFLLIFCTFIVMCLG